jgi:hypothetical protein
MGSSWPTGAARPHTAGAQFHGDVVQQREAARRGALARRVEVFGGGELGQAAQPGGRGLGLGMGSGVWLLFGLGAVAGTVLGGRAVDRFGPAVAIRLWLSVQVAALALALDHARRAQRQADFDGFAGASSDVRSAWLDRTPNGRLRDTLRKFDDQAAAVRQATLHDPRARATALARYEELAGAFADGDATGVERITERLIEDASGYFNAATAAAA